MDSSSKVSEVSGGIYRVRDPFTLLVTVILAVLACLGAWVANLMMFEQLFSGEGFNAIAASFNLIMLVVLFRLKTIWSGIELDSENRTMSFQGGGVAANDFSDFFNPNYLLQYFKRFNINIDEISQITADDHTRQFYNKSIKQWQTTTTYTISFVGSFGSASVNFSSGGKRDQIYNTIRQLNQMGTPVFKSN